MNFPAHFLWGAATSAYQIEGAPLADGAGPSIWHAFAHTPGRIRHGDTGDRACLHYERHATDLELMAALGLQAYRFSINWGRVLPAGVGAINPRGLDFYRRLVDGLLARGIVPMITLYHWDLPLALHERGGWLHPDSPAWFADYAAVLFRALDDRVPLWVTLNEPWVSTVLGYLEGIHAPGQRDPSAATRVGHHLLLAHAAAVGAYRALGRHAIGIALNLEPQHPASDSAADRAAAARRDVFVNRWFLEPLICGRYPPSLPALFGAAWPALAPDAVAGLRGCYDFLGVNYYTRARVRAAAGYPAAALRLPAGGTTTQMGWEIYPAGLTEILLWLTNEYGPLPLYVTENGAAFADPAPVNGLVADPRRIAYLRDHLAALHTALQQGAAVHGYFVWSLLDNFEWAEGYTPRFGLFQIDPASGARIPKASAYWYRDFIHALRTGFRPAAVETWPAFSGNHSE